jgi:hypothetical protein
MLIIENVNTDQSLGTKGMKKITEHSLNRYLVFY